MFFSILFRHSYFFFYFFFIRLMTFLFRRLFDIVIVQLQWDAFDRRVGQPSPRWIESQGKQPLALRQPVLWNQPIARKKYSAAQQSILGNQPVARNQSVAWK